MHLPGIYFPWHLQTSGSDSMIEYKVKILVKATGKPINDTLYDSLGAKIWIDRVAKKHNLRPDEVYISAPEEYERVWGNL